jgi:hypothetical protein
MMPLLRRDVLLVVMTAALLGCERGPRVCPDGMRVVADRSIPGKSTWCKSGDGRRMRWVELYDSKARRQSCAYNDGKPEGTFQSWHREGQQWVVGEYRAGRKIGKWTQWEKDGTRVAEGEYQNGTLVAGAPVGVVAACEKQKL